MLHTFELSHIKTHLNGIDCKVEHTYFLGAVTFIDILGWKGIYDRDKGACSNLIPLITDVKNCIPALLDKVRTIYWPEFPLTAEEVDIVSISDTIIIFIKGEISPTVWLSGVISKAIFWDAFRRNLPLQGSTSYGKYHYRSAYSMVVGPAVDEAATWHEGFDWIGLCQTPELSKKYRPRNIDPWILYNPPVKSNYKDLLKDPIYCLNWPEDWLEIYKTEGRSLIEKDFAKGNPDNKVLHKYEASFNFFDFSKGTKDY